MADDIPPSSAAEVSLGTPNNTQARPRPPGSDIIYNTPILTSPVSTLSLPQEPFIRYTWPSSVARPNGGEQGRTNAVFSWLRPHSPGQSGAPESPDGGLEDAPH